MAYEKIVKRFYDELENGKIMAKKCPRCGAVDYPPRIICNSCGNLETNWIEIKGDAEVTNVFLPAMMSTLPQNEVFQPYGLGSVLLAEGAEVNAIICGVTRKNLPAIQAKLAAGEKVPVKTKIAARDGYSMVVFELTESYEEA